MAAINRECHKRKCICANCDGVCSRCFSTPCAIDNPETVKTECASYTPTTNDYYIYIIKNLNLD